MNLDDLSLFKRLDHNNRLASIKAVPDNLLPAYEIGLSQIIPIHFEKIRSIVFCGMGESASAGELVAAYTSQTCRLPIFILRDYDLPAWVSGNETLVVLSSISGNTEEVISLLSQSISKMCSMLLITNGGMLLEMADTKQIPTWIISHPEVEKAWFLYLFSVLLALLRKMNLIPDASEDMNETAKFLRENQIHLLPEVQAVNNPAKRLAGQMVGRSVNVFASSDIAPVARRWKNQINLISKCYGSYDILPEANHNTLAGIDHPEELLKYVIALFLTSPSSNPRNILRLEKTREWFMQQGINTDFLRARGKSQLDHMWSLIQFGDYISFYLAAAYEEIPGTAEPVNIFKQDLYQYQSYNE